MGEISEMMIDGEMDFYTGEYLGPGVGYPRTHDRSLPWEQRYSGERAHTYLRPVLDRLRSRSVSGQKAFEVLNNYGQTIGTKSPTATCKHIQSSADNKGAFSVWLTAQGFLKPSQRAK